MSTPTIVPSSAKATSVSGVAPSSLDSTSQVVAGNTPTQSDDVVEEIGESQVAQAVAAPRPDLSTMKVEELPDIVAAIWALMHKLSGNPLIGLAVLLLSWVKGEIPIGSELSKLVGFPSDLMLVGAPPAQVDKTKLVSACTAAEAASVVAHRLSASADPIAPVAWALYRALSAGASDSVGLRLLSWFYGQKFKLRVKRRVPPSVTNGGGGGRGGGGRGGGGRGGGNPLASPPVPPLPGRGGGRGGGAVTKAPVPPPPAATTVVASNPVTNGGGGGRGGPTGGRGGGGRGGPGGRGGLVNRPSAPRPSVMPPGDGAF